MRALLFVTAMFVFGLAITFGTASVLQDVAVSHAKSARSDGFEGVQMPTPTMKPLKQGQSPFTDRSNGSIL